MDIVLNYENKHVRIAGTKKDPLFNGKDVCTILRIVNYRDALSTIDTDYKLIASTDPMEANKNVYSLMNLDYMNLYSNQRRKRPNIFVNGFVKKSYLVLENMDVILMSQ